MSTPGVTMVTGAAGFIGRRVLALRPDFIGVSRADADLTDGPATHALFARLRPSRVIHLAALTGGVGFHASRHAEVFATNTTIDANVVAAASASGTTRLVAVLASCAYPDGVDGATETQLHTGTPHASSDGIGRAKRSLDLACRAATTSARCFTTLSPVTVYGPGDRGGDHGHVVATLLDRARHARLSGAPLQVWGSGHAVRQFLYVDDLAELLCAEVAQDRAPASMIVAPDEGMSIADVAASVRHITGLDGPTVFTGDREGQLRKTLRSAEFELRHPQFRFTPFDEGLRRTLRSLEPHA